MHAVQHHLAPDVLAIPWPPSGSLVPNIAILLALIRFIYAFTNEKRNGHARDK